jgi:hypothetical protein
MRRLADLIRQLRARLHPEAPALHREGDGITRNRQKIHMTHANVHAVAAKYGIDLDGLHVKIDNTTVGKAYGVTLSDRGFTLYRDAFDNETELAAHSLAQQMP